MVFCSQEWPWPLSQSTPQASWGSRGRRLSVQLQPFAPNCPAELTFSPQEPPEPLRLGSRGKGGVPRGGLSTLQEKS